MSTQQQLDALTVQMRADEIRRQLHATPQPAGRRGVRSPPSVPSKKRKVSADSGYGSTMVTFKGSDDSLLLDIDSWAGAKLTFADGSSLDVDA